MALKILWGENFRICKNRATLAGLIIVITDKTQNMKRGKHIDTRTHTKLNTSTTNGEFEHNHNIAHRVRIYDETARTTQHDTDRLKSITNRFDVDVCVCVCALFYFSRATLSLLNEKRLKTIR